MSDEFIFPLNGLAAGRNSFRLHAQKAFFDSFENPEILDADLSVAVSVLRTGQVADVDCELEGTVTVPCDRCLEDLVIAVDEHPRLRFRFGEAVADDSDREREVIVLPASATELDLRQVVYDYACLAVPLHKVHPDGGCNPETLRFLKAEELPESHSEAVDSPFAGLKDLFKEKGKR